MNDTVIYGIKNCDTIKKTQKWLSKHELEFTFHDYRKDGLDRDWLINVCTKLGWELVLNKRGTTYRQLSPETKSSLDANTVIDVLLAQPAMIKRPILSLNGSFYLGFKEADYQTLFGIS